MAETDPMTIDERRKYIHRMWDRYRRAGRKEKGDLLDEMQRVTGMHRKSLLRVLNGRLSRKPRTKQRGRTYGVKVADAVKVIARSLDYPCAERLKPNLMWMAEHLVKHHELVVEPDTLRKLDEISVSTLKRMLKTPGHIESKLAYRKPPGPRRHTLRQAYPMRRIPWDTSTPGHFEVDLVLHSGEDAGGEYIHTIQMLDVNTGWSEIEAVYGRSYQAMRDGFRAMLRRLPFPVLELHPDNGSEFFNQHLLRFWHQNIVQLDVSRSRPYHKNDNRFVEENNHSLVRAYVGHGRLDTLQQLGILRELYQALWLYHNFFQPVMRTSQKVLSDPLHYRRVFDAARPPFDRVCEALSLPAPVLERLRDLREQTDPVLLREHIEELIDQLWSCPPGNSSIRVNVLDTLRKETDQPVAFSFEPSIALR